ncbi:MAG: carbon-nitrogen hydrolase family protein [Anaerolineae bacterium]|nr:carbon-nitrogen hydrolase family protein [Anaerolineae bacterium]NUQ03231.1 carbon-nitrogen hydrolase family protein [Anaerolineae bacterium]
MREVTVAVVQLKPRLGEIEDNLVKMSEMITTIASQQRVDLIVFPELITSGYELGVRFTEMAQRVPGPAVNLISQRANEYGVYVAFGMVVKERVESVLYNSAILLGPEGDLVEVYNKVHLRGEERMAFREGFKMPVVETEMGTIGLMIGYDLAFPEVARSLVLDGAEIVCVLANWEASAVDEWKTFLRSRAYENAVFMVGANRVGEDVTLTFGGESMIVGPRGQIYATLAGETDEKTGAPLEGFAAARIDIDEVRRSREEHQLIQNRQPTVYKTIVRRY